MRKCLRLKPKHNKKTRKIFTRTTERLILPYNALISSKSFVWIPFQYCITQVLVTFTNNARYFCVSKWIRAAVYVK